MEHTHEFVVTEHRERLDKIIQTQLPQLSRGQVQALIKDGLVSVNDKVLKAGEKLKGGETIRIALPAQDTPKIEAQDMPLTVLYEDEFIAVIDKPSGLVVHPAVGNWSGTLVNGLIARYPDMVEMTESDDTDEARVGIVHRLDKDTSGVMVIARTLEATRHLVEQFQERVVDKQYIALLERAPKTLTGIVDVPIGRDPKFRKRMSVQASGRPSKTQYEVLDNDFRDGQVLVKVTLFTGRTHQIRVHMAFLGCPVVGDELYGFRKRRVTLARQFLHASHLGFNHPVTGERLSFDSPLPEDLQQVLRELR